MSETSHSVSWPDALEPHIKLSLLYSKNLGRTEFLKLIPSLLETRDSDAGTACLSISPHCAQRAADMSNSPTRTLQIDLYDRQVISRHQKNQDTQNLAATVRICTISIGSPSLLLFPPASRAAGIPPECSEGRCEEWECYRECVLVRFVAACRGT
jgi:hypothetical protein